jgi:hypothetical protein
MSKKFLGGRARAPTNWRLTNAIKASSRPIECAPFSWRPHQKPSPQPTPEHCPRRFTRFKRKDKITLATKVTFLDRETE